MSSNLIPDYLYRVRWQQGDQWLSEFYACGTEARRRSTQLRRDGFEPTVVKHGGVE